MSFPRKTMVNSILVGMKMRNPDLFKNKRRIMFQEIGKKVVVGKIEEIMKAVLKYGDKNNIDFRKREDLCHTLQKLYPVLQAKIVSNKKIFDDKKHSLLTTSFKGMIEKSKLKMSMGDKKVEALTHAAHKIAETFGYFFADMFGIKKIKKVNTEMIKATAKMILS